MNSATLYHYARGKEEILEVIMRLCLEEMLRRARIVHQRSSDPGAQLVGMVRAHIGVTVQNMLTARVVDYEVRSLTGARRGAVIDLRDQYEELLSRTLHAGMESGEFDVRDASVMRLAIIELCNGVAHWYSPTGRLSPAEVQDEYVELCCRLLRFAPDSRTVRFGSDEGSVTLLCEPVGSSGDLAPRAG